MKLSKPMIAICRRLIDNDDTDRLVSDDQEFDVIRTTENEVARKSTELFQQVVEPVAKSESMFCSVSVIWAKYLFYELSSDTDMYFVIREIEG